MNALKEILAGFIGADILHSTQDGKELRTIKPVAGGITTIILIAVGLFCLRVWVI